jgi:Zn-dependent membrane protease YugP
VLVPAIQFSPTIAYLCILIGLLFNFLQLYWLGILFYAAMVAFIVLDLPVEFDASRRAMRLMREANLLQTEDDESGTRRMLTAAASTYVAAAVVAVLQLLYYISLGRRRS